MTVTLYGMIARFLGKNKGRVFSIRQLATRFEVNPQVVTTALKNMVPKVLKVRYGYKSLWGWRE